MPKAKRSSARQVVDPSSDQHKATSNKVKAATKAPFVSPITTLPYLILVDILDYARTEAPVVASLTDNKSYEAAWLIEAATVCLSFHEPALSVLYSSIRLNNPIVFRKLLETMQNKPDLGKYVKTIDVMPEFFLGKSKAKLDSSFIEILRLTPNVKNLCIRRGNSTSVFAYNFGTYPDGIFAVLEETGARLKSWTWNGYLTTEDLMIEQSQAKSFLTLTSLEFRQFHFTQSNTPVECEDKMLLVLSYLEYLTRLNFQMVEFVTDRFMELLHVESLVSLWIHKAPLLTSDGMIKFLKHNGSSLRELSLRQCENLNLEFIHILESSTPQLQHLDFEPYTDGRKIVSKRYASLLPLGSPVPTWPKYLQSLSLRSLARWTSLECIRLLQSLLDASEMDNFTHLHYLNMWCILPELGWRERARFREKWQPMFSESFLDPTCDQFRTYEATRGGKLEWFNPERPGSCYKVVFRVDDARPTDVQLSEEHFLDVERVSAFASGRRRRAASSTATTKQLEQRPAPPRTTRQSVNAAAAASVSKKRKRATPVQKQQKRGDHESDTDFEADELAYVDEDGENSAWDQDD